MIAHSHSPVGFVDQLLEPVVESLNEESARTLVNLRLGAAMQQRIDELAEKSTEGELTPTERSEYETYVIAIDVISAMQAKARRLLAGSKI